MTTHHLRDRLNLVAYVAKRSLALVSVFLLAFVSSTTVGCTHSPTSGQPAESSTAQTSARPAYHDPVVTDAFLDELRQPAAFECIEMKLGDVIADLNKTFGIPVRLDGSLSKSAGSELITINLSGVTRRSLLSHVLDCAGLDSFIGDNTIHIVTPETAQQRWASTSPAYRLRVRHNKGPEALANGSVVSEALHSPTRGSLQDVTLSDLLDFLSTRHSIRILLDYRAIEKANVADSPMNFVAEGKTLSEALTPLLAQRGLGMTIDNEVLLVTTKAVLARKLLEYGDYVEITAQNNLDEVRRVRASDRAGASKFLEEYSEGIANDPEIPEPTRAKVLRLIDACKNEAR